MQLEFSGQFFEKSSSSFIKIRPMGAELFHADGQTGTNMTKLIGGFRNFANAPKTRALTIHRYG